MVIMNQKCVLKGTHTQGDANVHTHALYMYTEGIYFLYQYKRITKERPHSAAISCVVCKQLNARTAKPEWEYNNYEYNNNNIIIEDDIINLPVYGDFTIAGSTC